MVGVALTAGGIFMNVIIGKVGRKRLYIGGMSFVFVSMLLLSIFVFLESEIAIIFIFTFIFGHGASTGPLFFIMAAEILPDIGLGLVLLSNWIEVLIVGFFFPMVSDPKLLGPGGTFLIFAVVLFIGVIFISVFVPETAGKS
jgi:hypothetical protein